MKEIQPTPTLVKEEEEEEEDPITDTVSQAEDCAKLPATSSNCQPFKSLFNLEDHDDSREAAHALFALLIGPQSVDKFFRYYEPCWYITYNLH